MKLKRINLANFRGFKQLEIEFDKQLTVIAGINGIGKSSILNALRRMTEYYHRDREQGEVEGCPFPIDDIKTGAFSLTADVQFKGKITGGSAQTVRSIPTPKVLKEVTSKIDSLTIQQSETKRGTKKHKEIEDRLRIQKRLLYGENEFRTLGGSITSPSREFDEVSEPLMIYFGSSRFLSRFAPKFKPVKAFSRADAFVGALDDNEVSIDLFAKWFRAVEAGKIGGKAKGKKLLQSLDELIARTLPDFFNLKFWVNPKPYFTISKGSETFELEQLSDGERAILSLCFDISRRLSIANPNSPSPTEEGLAIILIDEIELHLHPTWQRQILRNLQTAFPNCQFVVTTHSPQVIGEVPANGVRLLKDSDGKIVSETPGMAFGADSNWILNLLMDADGQNEEVKQALAEISTLLSEKNLDTAAERIASLRATVGNTEAIQRVASTFDRIRLIGK